MEKLLDIYTDYLQVTFGPATATNLSRMVDGSISHDQITRMLSKPVRDAKDLWLMTKPLVRSHETDDGCLIFDDTIIEKEYTDESDLICWHYDHSKGRSVKGINLLTAFYHTQSSEMDLPLCVPVSYYSIEKPVVSCDVQKKREVRKSPVTKNELLQEMVGQSLLNELRFTYVLGDSWFASADNMKFIHQKKKNFIFDMKSNRHAALSKHDQKTGQWTRIDALDITEDTPTSIWLRGVTIPLLLIKQIFKNKDGSTGVRYLVSNDLTLTSESFETVYKKRWSVEVYHKSLKQNNAISKSPTRTITTQKNHLFASICAYVKLERYKLNSSISHFTMKSKLYVAAIKGAFKELTALKENMGKSYSA